MALLLRNGERVVFVLVLNGVLGSQLDELSDCVRVPFCGGCTG